MQTMENVSDNTSANSSMIPLVTPNIAITGSTLWKICQAVLIFCTVADFYILVCLSHFYRKYLFHDTHKHTSVHFNCIKNIPGLGSNRNDRAEEIERPRRCSKFSEIPTARNRKRNKLKRWMLRAAISASLLAFLKCLIDQFKFYFIWEMYSNVACDVVDAITEVVLYGSIIVCVYGFLWIRQWMFYNSRAVKDLLYSRNLIRFSRWIPVPIVTIANVLAVFNIIPQRYVADISHGYAGCLSLLDIHQPQTTWSIVLYIIVTSTIQICLMGLFIYPFVKRKLYEKKRKQEIKSISKKFNKQETLQKTSKYAEKEINSSSTIETETAETTSNETKKNSNHNNNGENNPASTDAPSLPQAVKQAQIDVSNTASKKKKHKKKSMTSNRFSSNTTNHHSDKNNEDTLSRERTSRVFNSVRRVVIWCFMCILTDVTSVSVALSLGRGTPLILVTTLNNINVLANQLCIVATYHRWRQILFPWCRSCLSYKKDRLSNKSRTYSCSTLASPKLSTKVVKEIETNSCSEV